MFDTGEQALGIVLQPLAAAQFLQACLDGVVDLEQVLHVVGGVLQLRLREWAAHPVRAGFALGQGDAGDCRDQFLVTHAAADAGQRRTDLGIEQRARQHAAGDLEGNQVSLALCMILRMEVSASHGARASFMPGISGSISRISSPTAICTSASCGQ